MKEKKEEKVAHFIVHEVVEYKLLAMDEAVELLIAPATEQKAPTVANSTDLQSTGIIFMLETGISQ